MVGLRVTGSFFPLLGVQAALGRTLQPSDEHGSSVVVLSHGLWVRQFGGDPAIVGRNVVLDGTAHLVVGVMPAELRLAEAAPGVRSRSSHAGGAGGREGDAGLRRHRAVAVRRLGRAGEGVHGGAGEAAPGGVPGGQGVEHRHDEAVGGLLRRSPAPSRLLLLTGLFVLIIACANLANLMVSRAATRQREMALRAALGGGWKERLRPFLADGFVLSMAGGGLGLLLASGLSGALRSYVPREASWLRTAWISACCASPWGCR